MRDSRPTGKLAGVPSFHEFFAGGGMARAGLGPGWTCLYANDVDAKKAAAYRANWGGGEFQLGDVGEIVAADAPGQADLAWGSFPCQDLSVAGGGAGLAGARSGTFHGFWSVIRALARAGRGPRLVAVENVCGALTSRGGRDFATIVRTFAEARYRCGALVIDAALFVPQSRSRLFLIGAPADAPIDPAFLAAGPAPPFHPRALAAAAAGLPPDLARALLWWRLPPAPPRRTTLVDVIETRPTGTRWHTPEETGRLVARMAALHRGKLAAAQRERRPMIGALYRRTRRDAGGARVSRDEVRFDGLAGCLRTPAGGSSRQTILIVEGERVRSRLLSPRETARLMGLPDSYRLPDRATDAYHLTGDGVVVPVVAHLARHLLEPLLATGEAARRAAA